MPEEINLQNLKEQYPDFFKKTSPEVLNFIVSEETAVKIAEICLEEGVTSEEKIEKVAYQTALILLGQKKEKNLTEILETEENLNRQVAQKISISIRRFIFSKITKIQESQQEKNPSIQPAINSPVTTEGEKIKTLPEKDDYRELAE